MAKYLSSPAQKGFHLGTAQASTSSSSPAIIAAMGATPSASTQNIYDLSQSLSPDATFLLLTVAVVLAGVGLMLAHGRVVRVALRRVWG